MQEKEIRKAVRCFVLDNNGNVVVTKYNCGNKMAGYYDIPGGKIEENETAEQAAIRETKEETGLDIANVLKRGKIIVNYPSKIYDFDVFITYEFNGVPQNFSENTSQWMNINNLLKEEKILSNILILDNFLIKGLIDTKFTFNLQVTVDERENLLSLNYEQLDNNTFNV